MESLTGTRPVSIQSIGSILPIAYNVNPYNGFWKDEIGKFLEEYPEAAEMEQLRQKYFGAF